MIELALSLVDRIISVLRQRQLTDRQLHDDFLVPLLSDFERIHQNYLETFAKYKIQLKADSFLPDSYSCFLEAIEQDILFSSQLRAKARMLNQLSDDPTFSAVVLAIESYLSTGASSGYALLNADSDSNQPREAFMRGLRFIFKHEETNSSVQELSMKLLDSVIRDLQIAYQVVINEGFQVKKRLLDRRF